MVLHSLTNEIKSKNPETCIKDLEDIIWLIQSKWPAARVVISLATPRNDDIAYHTNVLVVNALLKQKYHDDENIRTVEHTNMFVDGIPNSEMLQDDNYHLNARGTSALAFKIKNAIHYVLNLQLPLRSRFDRSRSRNAFRGRGRGRGYMNQRRGHADMLTSDDRKEVDLHLQRGSIARGIFRDILEFFFLKYVVIGSCWRGVLKLTCKNIKYNIKK